MGPTRRCQSTYSRPRDTPLAEDTEAETLERQRRSRGRPRREPSTDHDLGSSRTSRDDDVPLPTVGEDAGPQMYDDAVPHVSEEGVPHRSEEGGGVRLPLQPRNPTCEVPASSLSDRLHPNAAH